MPDRLVSYLQIKIGGAQASDEVSRDLLDVSVENSLNLPDVLTLRLHDADFHWVDAATFADGVDIEAAIAYEKEGAKPLFRGEVVGMEMDMSSHGVPTVVVRCMDQSHRLHRGRHQAVFKQMTDSDIVKKVAGGQFTVEADPTKEVHEHVYQNNQTDWEFLTERARHCGYTLNASGQRTLHFKKLKDGGKSVQVDWGVNLRSFRPRTAAQTICDEITVRGWDPEAKKVIIGQAQYSGSTFLVPRTKAGESSSKDAKKFGTSKTVVVDRPVHSQGEAETLAKSMMDEIAQGYLEAEGLCLGDAAIMPGVTVDVQKVGTRFSGKYFVTATTHIYTPAEGYTTLFSVSGKQPRTLLSLMGGAGSDTGVGPGGHGVAPGSNIVIGIVTDNKDPLHWGRVLVKFPHLSDNLTSQWARQAAPMAGKDRGFYFLPEVDDEVLVAFEHGDIRRPYVIGSLWNGKDSAVEKSDKAVVGSKVERRTIKTRIGHTVLFDDTDNKGEMSMTTCNKNVLTLNDAKKNITAKTTNGHQLILDDENKNITAKTTSGHQILMDDSGAGKIVVTDKSGNTVTINSGDNSMKFECKGNFTVAAQGKVSVEGKMGIELKTPMQFKAEGAAGVDVKSTATLNLEGTAMTNLKSSGILTVQGSLVNIN